MKLVLGITTLLLLGLGLTSCGSAKKCDVSIDCDLGQACSADQKKCVDAKSCKTNDDCDGRCTQQYLICLTYYSCNQDSDCEEQAGICGYGIEIIDFQGNTHPGTCIE